MHNDQPTLPKRWDSLFDSEAGSDVVFVVGTEPDTWRFPGHRSVLRNHPVFRAMLEGPFSSQQNKIVIQDVDGRAFDHLLRYLYHEEVQLQSVSTALMTLYAANKYLCPELVEICVKYLDERINIETVLQIYQHLRLFADDMSSQSQIDAAIALPSAPPEDAEDDDNKCSMESSDLSTSGANMTVTCTSLLFNCYHYIDLHADQVLGEESIEDLTQDALYDLAKRDTLGVTSESILFAALERWCNRECKRCKLELSERNRKFVLGDKLLFSVRYLQMTSEEFLSGPMRSGLFDQTETNILLGHILQQPVSLLASCWLTPPVISFLRTARRKEPYAPIKLSDRSAASKQSKGNLKKEKKKKKKQKDGEDNKCLKYTINVLSAIFD